MKPVDPTSSEYQEFLNKLNYAAGTFNPHVTYGGSSRLQTTENTVTIHSTQIAKMASEIDRMESQILAVTTTVTELQSTVGKVVEILKVMSDVLVNYADMADEPMVQLDDDEFFAAAADPEAYNRRLDNADKRSSSI